MKQKKSLNITLAIFIGLMLGILFGLFMPGRYEFALPVIQNDILSNAARYVRPGGVLVYSTCTILPEENGAVTDGFLADHPDFTRTPFTLPAPVGETDGQLTLWPQRHGTDGFYICRMERRK